MSNNQLNLINAIEEVVTRPHIIQKAIESLKNQIEQLNKDDQNLNQLQFEQRQLNLLKISSYGISTDPSEYIRKIFSY